MTDIHCHFLYGVDDGAKTPEETLSMLNMAYQDGVRTIIATPHYNEHHDADAAHISDLLKAVSAQVADTLPGLKLYPGNECYLNERLLDALQTGKCLTMAGGRYVLTEISSYMMSKVMIRMLSEIISSGYTPIVAHCERLIQDKGDLSKISMLKELGCLLQVNASTILEKNGRWFDRWLYGSLLNGDISFISSDAHNLSSRRPVLSEAYEAVARNTSSQTANEVFRKNAETLLLGNN